MIDGGHLVVIPSTNSGRSITITSLTPSTRPLACSSLVRVSPNPSALPIDRQGKGVSVNVCQPATIHPSMHDPDLWKDIRYTSGHLVMYEVLK
jgi:hypothetical protein